MIKKRFISMLVLLAAVVSGAWATIPNSIVINGTPQVGDKSISLTYHFDPNNVPGLQAYAPTLKVKCAADNKSDEIWLSLSEVSSGTTSISLNNIGEFEAGKTYEVCFAYNNGNWVDEVFQSFVPAAPATTYSITVKEGTEDATSWTIAPAEATTTGVAAGTTVTATYSGTKKVKSVKAVKQAYTLLSAATTSDYGKVVCAAGHLHLAKTAVLTGCTAVGILGKVTETGHGLILALQDATSQSWNTINGWTSVTTYAGTTLKQLPDNDARGGLTSYTTLGSTTVSNWCVAQKSDYEAIFINLGSTAGDEDGITYDDKVNAYITPVVGGTDLSGYYWSATEKDAESGWTFCVSYWVYLNKGRDDYSLRPVLGF